MTTFTGGKPPRDLHVPHPAPPRLPFRPDIEGLRGVAVSLVVAYHVGIPGFGGGFVGVDVFFVISGYLITGLLATEVRTSGRIAIAAFFARRMQRLLPLALVVIGATVMASFAMLSPLELPPIVRSAQAALLYVANFRFARLATDYLAGDASADPLLHLWSLAVEEQFYVIWPLLLALGYRIVGQRPQRLGAVLIATCVASFALSVALTSRIQPYAFFLTPARWWELAVGGIAFLYADQIRRTLPGSRATALAAAAALAASVVIIDSFTPFPGWAALAPVLSTVAILSAGARDGVIVRVLNGPVLQFAGRLSYGWYLWHWPALVLLEAVYPQASLGTRCAVGGASLAAAFLTYHLVEKPWRRAEWPRLRPGFALVGGTGVVGLALLLCLAGSYTVTRALTHGQHASLASARADIPRIYQLGCVVGVSVTEVADSCRFGDARAETNVVLYGDSHAAHWFTALEPIALRRGWRLHVIIKSSCPGPLVRTYSLVLRRRNDPCEAWQRNVIRYINDLKPAVVIMASFTRYLDPATMTSITSSDWQTGLRGFSRGVRASSPTLVVIRDVPTPGFDVPVCHSRAEWEALGRRECTFDRRSTMHSAPVVAAYSAVAEVPEFVEVDLNHFICASQRCPTRTGDTLIYRDDHHLTARFARSLSPYLESALPVH